MASILIVEDDASIAEGISERLLSRPRNIFRHAPHIYRAFQGFFAEKLSCAYLGGNLCSTKRIANCLKDPLKSDSLIMALANVS